MKGTRLIQLICILLLSSLLGFQSASATETKGTHNDTTQEMTDKEFSTNLRGFFEGTLKNLKKILEN